LDSISFFDFRILQCEHLQVATFCLQTWHQDVVQSHQPGHNKRTCTNANNDTTPKNNARPTQKQSKKAQEEEELRNWKLFPPNHIIFPTPGDFDETKTGPNELNPKSTPIGLFQKFWGLFSC